MTSLLDLAFSPDPPGDPLPPGPRVNDWRDAGATPVPGPSAEADLLDALWAPRGWHLRADGRSSSVPRRLVPSAGGTYPVQWHVVVPAEATSVLPPGRYVRDEAGRLLRRPGPPTAGRRVSIALTVQAGRSYGRYRHRAWPLWVADAAYALEAVLALVPAARLPRSWHDLAAVRDLLGVAPATQTHWWVGQGLAPELCLARVDLADGWQVDGARLAVLGGRRSPSLTAFVRRAEERPHPCPGALEVVAQSSQRWVLGADRVHTWPRPEPAGCGAAYGRLWQTHREAARLCYRLAGHGAGTRPVSGLTGPSRAGGRPLLHALAVLVPQETSR